MSVASDLLDWYALYKRPLPWRSTRDPYTIWLSEVILQQTRVSQGTDYYFRFLEAFPTVQSLASASEQEVLRIWQGLGYYSRARNMHHTAREIVAHRNGLFPQSASELQQLKGIGHYTAAAIASICFGEPVAVIDGNVARVLSRLFALDFPVNTTRGTNELRRISQELMAGHPPAEYNQAVMELGALVCTPANPGCSRCPVVQHCKAFAGKRTAALPVKAAKKPPLVLYISYLEIYFDKENARHVILRRRSGNGIWKNMYDFPSVESAAEPVPEDMLDQIGKMMKAGGTEYSVKEVSPLFVHQLTHRTLKTVFFRIEAQSEPILAPGQIAVPLDEISNYPLPRLIDRYLRGN